MLRAFGEREAEVVAAAKLVETDPSFAEADDISRVGRRAGGRSLSRRLSRWPRGAATFTGSNSAARDLAQGRDRRVDGPASSYL